MKGLEKGKQQGLQEGLKKGMEKGEKQKAIEIAKSLLDILDILDIQTLAEKTGLSEAEIKALK